MKILWITNNPLPQFLPEIKGKPVSGGSWIAALANELAKEPDIQLSVVTNVEEGTYAKIQLANVTQYTIPIRKNGWYVVNDLYPELIESYQQVEKDCQPDVIHIHGTERYFGLLTGRGYMRAPSVISIQGIISAYLQSIFGGIKESDLRKMRSIKNILGRGGIINHSKEYRKYSKLEEEIFALNRNFFCRTNWDRSQVISYNRSARVFQGEELLRMPFYQTQWSLEKSERHSIFISSGTIPIKGLHVMLKALALLKREYPSVKLYIPLDPAKFLRASRVSSNDYEIYIQKLAQELGVVDNLVATGRLNEVAMAQRFASSHVFVLPSFCENSPNSLGEAMMVGTPTVVSPVGGVPDIVQNNESSLFAPEGDAPMLFYQVRRIFQDDALAMRLSKQAKQIALKRHGLPETVMQYKAAYREVSKNHVDERINATYENAV